MPGTRNALLSPRSFATSFPAFDDASMLDQAAV